MSVQKSHCLLHMTFTGSGWMGVFWSHSYLCLIYLNLTKTSGKIPIFFLFFGTLNSYFPIFLTLFTAWRPVRLSCGDSDWNILVHCVLTAMFWRMSFLNQKLRNLLITSASSRVRVFCMCTLSLVLGLLYV